MKVSIRAKMGGGGPRDKKKKEKGVRRHPLHLLVRPECPIPGKGHQGCFASISRARLR